MQLWTERKARSGMTYYSVGENSTIVLLLHGLGCTAAKAWCHYKQTIMLASNRQLIAVDLWGHGKSHTEKQEKYTIQGQASSLLELLLELKVQHVAIIGHSLGAQLAMCLGELVPETVSVQVICVELSMDLQASKIAVSKNHKDVATLWRQSTIDWWFNVDRRTRQGEPLWHTLRLHSTPNVSHVRRIYGETSNLNPANRLHLQGGISGIEQMSKMLRGKNLLGLGDGHLPLYVVPKADHWPQRTNPKHFFRALKNLLDAK